MGAFYQATLAEFLLDDPSRIIGRLSTGNQHNELQRRQIKAWEREIDVLKLASNELIRLVPKSSEWGLLLEYTIPRRHKRLDAVLLADDVIFCLEFKTEDKAHSLQPMRQVEDYALDLRDFHQASRDRRIVPIVVVPNAARTVNSSARSSTDAVRNVCLANAADLAMNLFAEYNAEHDTNSLPIEPVAWNNSTYRPVPTIIEAAEALFAGHGVCEIEHSHAGATNLTLTTDRLMGLIQRAQSRSEKLICFVTGVPGSGKTLAGLKLVHNPSLRNEGRPAGVFLSGNGPLVKVVSEAIVRDHKRREQNSGAKRTIGTLVQNVHTFIRVGIEKLDKPPFDRIVVFDEAQRAWNAAQNRKKNGQEISEPETLLGIMDRHEGWAVVIALVGGGQEIHDGEAGLAEWGRTLREKFPHWIAAVSPKVLDLKPSNVGFRLFDDGITGSVSLCKEPDLHLDVHVRSFRAQRYADWVDAALSNDATMAAEIVAKLTEFPFAMTRSLTVAREWLRCHARGQQRAGLLASSGALRLRADGIELSSGFRTKNGAMFVNWFLNHPPDVRSSNQLEVAASQFECQGLEVDWSGVCWGSDFVFDPDKKIWDYLVFRGSRWNHIKNEIDRCYLLNTYRVLLTRARRGSIIWVPEGDSNDDTRLPEKLNATADYLAKCGVPLI